MFRFSDIVPQELVCDAYRIFLNEFEVAEGSLNGMRQNQDGGYQ